MRIESVEIVSENSFFAPRWEVTAGDEAWKLLQHQEKLNEQSRQNIMDDAVAILSQCLPPSAPEGRETGLVLGYVQSGKTLSFTTVTALARDNGYPVVIVIAGTSLPLSGQSLARLNDDLRLDKRSDRQWLPIHNPSLDHGDADKILNVIENWNDIDVPFSFKQTILITVMKHHQHLLNLSNILNRLPLHNVPTLVIDDEADQAGLNSKVRKGEVSTTHQNLAQLRAMLPHHTFLQYTATPQALLLINMLNTLSPNFCYVLEPGEDYVGGKDFFTPASPYIRTIPLNEVQTKDDRLLQPPGSLIEAMRVFLVGVAAGNVENTKKDRKRKHHRNRSMMVHPSMHTDSHNDYMRWVEQIKYRWAETLGLPEDEPDRQELIAEFREAYDDLLKTEQDIPAFEEIASWPLKHAISTTQVTRMNASRGKTPSIDWRNVYSHILVGGQAMNRGFTVEGLTITYMPRGVGGRNADTIQQRARFFGHKRNILGYCRVYLEQETEEAFFHYIQHEESVRTRIIEFNKFRRPLNEWKRAFVLDSSLWPTRRSVLDQAYVRDKLSDEWYSTKVPHNSLDAIASNRKAVEAFKRNFNFSHFVGESSRNEGDGPHGQSQCATNQCFQRFTSTVAHDRNTRLELPCRYISANRGIFTQGGY